MTDTLPNPTTDERPEAAVRQDAPAFGRLGQSVVIRWTARDQAAGVAAARSATRAPVGAATVPADGASADGASWDTTAV